MALHDSRVWGGRNLKNEAIETLETLETPETPETPQKIPIYFRFGPKIHPF